MRGRVGVSFSTSFKVGGDFYPCPPGPPPPAKHFPPSHQTLLLSLTERDDDKRVCTTFGRSIYNYSHVS